MEITIHRIRDIGVSLHMPENGNVIKLTVVSDGEFVYDHEGNGKFSQCINEISLYDLPTETTEGLIELLGQIDSTLGTRSDLPDDGSTMDHPSSNPDDLS